MSNSSAFEVVKVLQFRFIVAKHMENFSHGTTSFVIQTQVSLDWVLRPSWPHPTKEHSNAENR